jgi:hypothetical protein
MYCYSVFYEVADPDNWEDGKDRFIANGLYLEHRCQGPNCHCWEMRNRGYGPRRIRPFPSRPAQPYKMDTDDWNPPKQNNKLMLLLTLLGLVLVVVCSGAVWSFWSFAAPDSWQQTPVQENCLPPS